MLKQFKTNTEKLYELAGVEKRVFSAVIQGEFPQRIHERFHPPFTPEKQLELIKWLAKNITFGVLIHEYGHMWWDVAGYEHNSENVCALSFDKNADFEEDFLCQDNPNCYFKQLKRKEEECEAYKMEAEEGIEINAELEAENEKYKQALQEIKDYCNKYPQNSIGFKKQILQKCEVID